MHTRIDAILSDYDGTLYPTDPFRNNTDSIFRQLDRILWDISQRIPVCIISSKDYHFIHRRAKFVCFFHVFWVLKPSSLECVKKHLMKLSLQ
jgi:trehalose-6-phosphatase